MNKNYNDFSIDFNKTLIDALKLMDKCDHKLLIVTKSSLFAGLISIGDIQRAIIQNKSLDTSIKEVLRSTIRTAKQDDSYESIKKMMFDFRMELCPIINKKNDSLLLDIGESETSMLDKLFYNNILTDIIGETIKYGPLLGGRHRCNFDTIIGSNAITIQGSQYETDGCYETENYVCIVEAKSIKCDDFNIRQLYYPFREVYKKVGGKKQIICLFVFKDKKNIIHIHKFKWNNYEKMMDIVNIGYYQYYYS